MPRNRIADSTDIGDRLREIQAEKEQALSVSTGATDDSDIRTLVFTNFANAPKGTYLAALTEDEDGDRALLSNIIRCHKCNYPNSCSCFEGYKVWASIIK